MEKENESYQPKYRYGAIVRFHERITHPIGVHMRNGILLSTYGTDANNARVLISGGWARDEKDVRPLTLREFFYWKDPATGMRRIGLMGWIESIVIPLATLGIFAMSFTDMSVAWAWVVRGLSFAMASFVIVHTIREHRRMYRKPNPRTA